MPKGQEQLSQEEIQGFFDQLDIGTEEEREKYRVPTDTEQEETKVICLDNVTTAASTSEQTP